MTEDTGQTVKAHCNQCRGVTRHTVIGTRRSNRTEEHKDEHGRIVARDKMDVTHQMLECCGCDEITLREEVCYEGMAPGDLPYVTYYPPAVSRHLPEWRDKLPHGIRLLLLEVYRALHSDSRSLAIMGARALIDMVAVEKVGDQGSFKEMLTALVNAAIVTKPAAEALKAAIEAGHAAAHRGHVASPEDVDTVIDIVENLLQTVYVLSTGAERLRATTPPRPS